MQVQTTLENKVIPTQNGTAEKPWKGQCCRRCWYAKSDKTKCRCRCLGVNHQKGLHEAVETKEESVSNQTFVKCNRLRVKCGYRLPNAECAPQSAYRLFECFEKEPLRKAKA